jgi:hypothetical protein
LSRKAVHSWAEKRGKRYLGDEEVETEARKWLRQQSKDFCAMGKYISVGMSRNECRLQVGISQGLRFIFVCDLFTDTPSYIWTNGTPCTPSLGNGWICRLRIEPR